MTQEAAGPPEGSKGKRFGLFEAYGVEIELMLVDAHTLDVKPVCDALLAEVAGGPDPRGAPTPTGVGPGVGPAWVPPDVELGDVTWSNELTLHVLELKTSGPASSLAGLARGFHESLHTAKPALHGLGARIMSGAMHPWMDPHRETVLWPHENNEVYRTFDRIFGCSGHGWSNVQSTHVNLPFADDEEFARLHAAIRIALPLIPALAASSPFQDGRVGPALDGRLVAYRMNSVKVPSVAGLIVPEPVRSREQYEREILQRLYADLAPHDPMGVLRDEWANARGAIARFGRGTIEIRLMDSQECPTADLGVVGAIVSLVRSLAVGRLAERDLDEDPPTDMLARLLDRTILEGDRAVAEERGVLSVLGVRKSAVPLGELWARLLDAHPPDDPGREWTHALQTILDSGPLARRMLALAGPEPEREDIRRVAETLCRCVADDTPLSPDDR